MWRPDTVVSEHKRRAKAVWIGLLLITVGYTIRQIVIVNNQYKNPNTTLNISNDLYDFPNLNLCFMDGYGCHYEDEGSDNCVSTATSSVSFEGEIYEMAHTLSEEYSECIEFDASALEVNSARFPTFKPRAYISVEWTVSTSPSNNTSYSELLGVVLGDFESYALTYVPYARTVFPRTEEIPELVSSLTIQKTHRTYLSSDDKDTFTMSTIATAAIDPYEISDDVSQETRAVGRLHLIIEQAPYSLVEISDDVILSVSGLLGNVGGFWELLLVAWAVFFVSASNESEPEFKARNLTKSIKHGREAVGKIVGRSRAAATPQTAEPAIEARTDMEAPYRADLHVKDSVPRSASADGDGAGDSVRVCPSSAL